MRANSEYHGGDNMFVYAGEEINDSVRLHELAHQYLTKSTHWGMMIYQQAQLRRADKLYHRIQYHKEIGNLLMQAAENTFESHATMLQLLYVKGNNSDELKRLLDSPYCKMYNQEYFRLFLELDLPIMEAVHLCQRIPMLALATDLMDAEPEYWKTRDNLFYLIRSNPTLYNPDVRFEHLVNTYIRLTKEKNVSFIEDVELVKESGLFVKTTEYDDPTQLIDVFSDLIKRVFINDHCIEEAFELIHNTSVIGEMVEIINNAGALDIPLPLREYETIMIEKLEQWLNECPVLIMIPYEESVILEYHLTEFSKRYVCMCQWDALPILYAKFKKNIVLYQEDYDFMKKRFPYLHNKRVFYYFEGNYKYFYRDIQDRILNQPPVFLYKINEKTYCIFVKGNQNEIFFTSQNQGGIKLFVDDLINERFNYINLNDSKMDEYFYVNDIDWAVYEDVIKSVLHIKYTLGRCDISEL